MRPLKRSLLWTACVVFSLGSFVASAQQSHSDADLASAQALTASAALPDSPGAVLMQEPQQQSSGSASSTSQPENQTAPQSSEQPKEEKLQRPIGTAAAPAPGVSGITAAQPAGVAIAPAKQRRVRTIVIRVGAILGASAALGTVIALTAATPSKPPGAH